MKVTRNEHLNSGEFQKYFHLLTAEYNLLIYQYFTLYPEYKHQQAEEPLSDSGHVLKLRVSVIFKCSYTDMKRCR